MASTLFPPSAHRPTAAAGPIPVLRQLARFAAAALIAGHGAAHVMGVSLLWKLGEPGSLKYADASPDPGTTAAYLVGGLWLLAGLAFVTAAVLLLAHKSVWRLAAASGVAISVPVVALRPAQGAAGLVTNGIVLALVGLSLIPIGRRART